MQINPAVLAQLPLEMQRELAESMPHSVQSARQAAKLAAAAAPQGVEALLETAPTSAEECRAVWGLFEQGFEQLVAAPQPVVWRRHQGLVETSTSKERQGQDRVAALAAELREWAAGLAEQNLEGLQWVLRQMGHAAVRWPQLGAELRQAAEGVQQRAVAVHGAPVFVPTCCRP